MSQTLLVIITLVVLWLLRRPVDRVYKGFLKFLAQIPGRVWALLYLLLIPGFAVVYMKFPGEFYHGTAKYEAHLNPNADKLLEDIRKANASYVRRSESGASEKEMTAVGAAFRHGSRAVFYEPHNPYYPPSIVMPYPSSYAPSTIMNLKPQETRPILVPPKVLIKLDKSVFYSPEVHDGYLSIRIFERVGFDGTKEFVSLDDEVKVAVKCTHFGNSHVVWASEAPDGFSDYRVYPKVSEPTNPAFRHSMAVLHHNFHFDQKSGHYLMRLPNDLAERLHYFIDAADGFPYGVTEEFGRMCYLSAVTLTTLGYGDIVPLTTAARWAVTSEAILGIILIGFFLNSYSKGLKESVRKDS